MACTRRRGDAAGRGPGARQHSTLLYSPLYSLLYSTLLYSALLFSTPLHSTLLPSLLSTLLYSTLTSYGTLT
jgi:hypothetical protein